MKKLTVTLLALVMVFALAVASADDVFSFRNGITFGMTEDEVIAKENVQPHEIDTERTHGPVTFKEVEYENLTDDNVRGDVKYLFHDNKLVAIRVGMETRDITAEDATLFLTEKIGEKTDYIAERLGNAIYAIDDDGVPEENTVVFLGKNVIAVLEVDDDGDEIDITFLDPNADYIK